jgi:hypothetical protein
MLCSERPPASDFRPTLSCVLLALPGIPIDGKQTPLQSRLTVLAKNTFFMAIQ